MSSTQLSRLFANFARELRVRSGVRSGRRAGFIKRRVHSRVALCARQTAPFTRFLPQKSEHSPERVRRNLMPLKAKKAAAKAATKRKAPQGGEKVAAAAKKRAGASDMEADDDGLAIFAQHARPATATSPDQGEEDESDVRQSSPPLAVRKTPRDRTRSSEAARTERAREEGRQRSKPSRSARGLPTVEEQMREAAEANEEGAAGAGAEEAVPSPSPTAAAAAAFAVRTHLLLAPGGLAVVSGLSALGRGKERYPLGGL